jgi:hypothetical protein
LAEFERESFVLRTVAEHRSLAALFEETRAVLRREDEAGASRVARGACARLREAVEAHLEREESLYYPTIGALRPDHKDALLGLAESQPDFRAHLVALTEAVEAEALVDAERRLDEITRLFHRRKAEEEKLLESLESEIETAD